MYQRIWNPEIGEMAVAALEVGNAHDRYAVAILEDHTCTSPRSGFSFRQRGPEGDRRYDRGSRPLHVRRS